MFCPSCGTPVADGDQFCPSCGTSMAAGDAGQAPAAPVEPVVQAAPVFAPPPQAPAVQAPVAPAYAPPPQVQAPPKKKRGCLIAVIIIAALLLCCLGTIGAGYFGLLSLGKPRDLGVRYTEADYQSATTKLGIDVSMSGPDSPTAKGEVPATDPGATGGAAGGASGSTGGATTTDATTKSGGTKTGGTTTKATGTKGSAPVTEGPAKGTKVVYEGSRPIDITLTSAEFSALMSMHHYSPNWLVQDFQVKFGENGQLEMSGYVVWDGRMYGGYAQANAQLTGPQSVGGSITKLEGLGVEIPQEYNGPAGDYIAGVMNDWLAQMEGLNLQSATIEGGQLHIVGTVPARVVRVPAGQ